METKFTPGPWKVESDPYAYDTLTTVTGGGSDRVLNLTRELIVEVGGYAGYETAEANATLIAAAPEMYEILCDVLTDCKLSDGMRLEIERIIKKAGGEK